MPHSQDRATTVSASTWMQVVFGGLGVAVAIAALVIAYFAWVQPHSPDGGDQAAKPLPGSTSVTRTSDPPTAPAAVGRTGSRQQLAGLRPALGDGYVRRSGTDLVIPCGTGDTGDRQRTVGWDLLKRYAGMEAELRVSKARDSETPLQLKIFADDAGAADKIITKAKSERVSIDLTGREKVQFQLTCQFSDSELTVLAPVLIRP